MCDFCDFCADIATPRVWTKTYDALCAELQDSLSSRLAVAEKVLGRPMDPDADDTRPERQEGFGVDEMVLTCFALRIGRVVSTRDARVGTGKRPVRSTRIDAESQKKQRFSVLCPQRREKA